MDYDIPEGRLRANTAITEKKQSDGKLSRTQRRILYRYLQWERNLKSENMNENSTFYKEISPKVRLYFESRNQHKKSEQTSCSEGVRIKPEPECTISQEPLTAHNFYEVFHDWYSEYNSKKRLIRKLKDCPNKDYSLLNHLHVAIIDKSNPEGKISQTDINLLRQHILKELDRVLFSQQQLLVPPTFYDMLYADEVFSVYCENDHSLKWLHKTVQSIPKVWSNSQFAVVELSTLPGLLMRATLVLPGKVEELAIILRRLDVQNPWASVKDWKMFFHNVISNSYLSLIFGINAQHRKALEARNYKLFYGFTSLNLKLQLQEGYHTT